MILYRGTLNRVNPELILTEWDVSVDGFAIFCEDPVTVLENNDRLVISLVGVNNQRMKKTNSQAVQCHIRAGHSSRGIQCDNAEISIEKSKKSDKLRTVSSGQSSKSAGCQTDNKFSMQVNAESTGCQTDAGSSVARTEHHEGYTTMTSAEVKNVLQSAATGRQTSSTEKSYTCHASPKPVKQRGQSRKDLGRFRCSEKVKRDSSLSSGSDDEVNKNWTAEAVIKFCDQLQASRASDRL